jgi:hypothetical protein
VKGIVLDYKYISNFNGVNMTLALFGVATFVAYESDGMAVSGNISS